MGSVMMLWWWGEPRNLSTTIYPAAERCVSSNSTMAAEYWSRWASRSGLHTSLWQHLSPPESLLFFVSTLRSWCYSPQLDTRSFVASLQECRVRATRDAPSWGGSTVL